MRQPDVVDLVAKSFGMSRLEVLIGLKDRLEADPRSATRKNYVPAMRRICGLIRDERKRIAAEIGPNEPMSGAMDVASTRRRS